MLNAGDIAAHQCEQFLHFAGSTAVEVLFRTGFARVDWYSPKGLGVWGDGRLTILGTDGYIEIRKYIDLAGQPGADHLFLVDDTGIQRIDCADQALSYGPKLIADIRDRTETAMSQDHCFLATELALKAKAMAIRVGDPG